MDEVGDVLTHTKETLRQYGWLKNRLGNQRTGFCLIGAVRHAVFGNGPVTRSKVSLYIECIKVLHRACAQGDLPLQAWNDADDRTLDHVHSLLDQTIHQTR